MATEIYLGNPPPYMIDWIKAHSKPAIGPKTKIMFTDGSVDEYDLSGEISTQTIKDAGVYDLDKHVWIKNPQTVEIGTKVTSIGGAVFSACTDLTSVTIPTSVTSIKDSAFYDCIGLTNITIQEGITSIGGAVFYGCEMLTNITIPSSVTSIDSWAFGNCYKLTDVTFSGKDKATVKAMKKYSWSLASGCVIHCADGDITI